MKQEHDIAPRGSRPFSFVAPLYASILDLSDGGPISRREITMCYNLSSIGLSPKRIKIPRDITMEDIHKYFGHVHNKNGYSYVFSEDLEVIAKVKGLWMIIHQKPYVPGSQFA